MRLALRLSLLAVTGWAFFGCGGQSQTARDVPADQADQVRSFEADFDPSSVEPAPGSAARHVLPDSGGGPADLNHDSAPAQTEMVQGFRVQVFSTTSIDEANAKKAEVEAAIPQERIYLDFDPPAYKLRAGNFLTRHDADRFVRFLADRGFSGAWAVPQRVLKNPPPSPAPATDPSSP
jgi:hypothetical protein